jgi:hypothetical protein
MLSLCLRHAAQPGNVAAISVGLGGGHAAMAAVIERQNVTVHPTGAALAADIEGVDLAGALTPETAATGLAKNVALEAKVLAAGD